MSDETSEAEDGGGIRDMVREFAKCSLTMTTSMRRKCQRWAVVLHAFFTRRIDQATGGSNDRVNRTVPTCRTYQSDGWSVFVSPRLVAAGVAARLTRTGKAKLEFMMEFGTVQKFEEGGDRAVFFDLRPPRPMLDGTKGWHVFQASCDFWEHPRQGGGNGLIASVYIQDGLHAHAFGLHCRARHALWYDRCCELDEDEQWLLQMTDLVVPIECKLHVGARAVKWSIKRFASEEILENTHSGIKGLVRCSATIYDCLSIFLHRVVVFDAAKLVAWETREPLWQALGVDCLMLHTFQRANPFWDVASQRLYVDPGLEHDPEKTSVLDRIFCIA